MQYLVRKIGSEQTIGPVSFAELKRKYLSLGDVEEYEAIDVLVRSGEAKINWLPVSEIVKEVSEIKQKEAVTPGVRSELLQRRHQLRADSAYGAERSGVLILAIISVIFVTIYCCFLAAIWVRGPVGLVFIPFALWWFGLFCSWLTYRLTIAFLDIADLQLRQTQVEHSNSPQLPLWKNVRATFDLPDRS